MSCHITEKIVFGYQPPNKRMSTFEQKYRDFVPRANSVALEQPCNINKLCLAISLSTDKSVLS